MPIRAAHNKLKGRMRPAGRQFDMPGVNQRNYFENAIACNKSMLK